MEYFNGWSGETIDRARATWRAARWCMNNNGLYAVCVEFAETALRRAIAAATDPDGDSDRIEQDAIDDLAGMIRNTIEETTFDNVFANSARAYAANFRNEIIGAWIALVDWSQIAEAFIGDARGKIAGGDD